VNDNYKQQPLLQQLQQHAIATRQTVSLTDWRSRESPNSTSAISCGLVGQFVFLTGLLRLLTNISTILDTDDDSFDVLAASCTVNVACKMLCLHNAASLRSSKRVSANKTKFKFLGISSCGVDHFPKNINII